MTVIPFRSKAQLKSGPSKFQGADAALFAPPPPGLSAIGIDLGTTNSVVSIYTAGCEHPETLEFEGGLLVPSMLYYNPTSSTEVIGAQAKEQLELDPSSVVRSTKRSMGQSGRVFSSGAKTYTPEQAATAVLKYISLHPRLQQEAQQHGGIWAVITVPAHFDDAARMATIDAAKAAGIHVLRIVNEPTAAALAYSMLPDVRDLSSEVVAVFDLGGGTFDVSIVERDGLVFNVLASEGDVKLGGDDLDEALAHQLLTHVTPQLTARRSGTDSEVFRKLLCHAETAKIRFQSEGVVHLTDLNLDGRGAQIDITLNRDVFEHSAAPFVTRTLELTERAMHAAKKRPSQVSRILLVGGSTRVNLVQKMLEGYFPGCLVDARLEPDLAVSWGASVQSAIILGIEPDIILVDVCSHTLGIGVAEDSHSVSEHFRVVSKKFGIHGPVTDEQLQQLLGDKVEQFNLELQKMLHVAPIVHRNSALPARRSEFFSTLYENQAAVQVVVTQGENDTVGENKFIGSFLFELEQPCPSGSRCEIQLTYDVNGMVHVLARQLETTNEAEAVFDSRTGEVSGWRHLATQELVPPVAEFVPFLTPPPAPSAHKTLSLVPNSARSTSAMSPDDPENSLQKHVEKSAEIGANDAKHLEGSNKEPVQFSAELEQPSGEIRVLNALLARARRVGLTLPSQSQMRHHLSGLSNQYAKLLREAQLGAQNDEEIDDVEAQILKTLDQVSP